MLVKPAVLAYIKHNQPVHMNQIVNALYFIAGQGEVESAVYQLVNDGKIRSTSDGYVVC